MGNCHSESRLLQFIDIMRKDGSTPLYRAVSNNAFNVIQLLLEKNANPYSFNKNGKTPLQLAIDCNQQQTVKMIRRLLALKKTTTSATRQHLLLAFKRARAKSLDSYKSFDPIQHESTETMSSTLFWKKHCSAPNLIQNIKKP